jgi:peptidoglycan/LPS O-acetylase OafA/YrhL
VLRIYPLYLVVFAATCLLLWTVPEAADFGDAFGLPETTLRWIANATLIGLAFGPDTVVMPAWSLWSELAFYALIPVLARNRVLTVLWFAGALIYASYAFGGGVWARYHAPIAAALPFSIGAMIYHFPTQSGRASASLAAIGSALFAAIILTALAVDYGVRMNLHFYLAYVAAALMVAGLGPVRAPNEPLRRLDARLGDLAYPIFLVHFTIGAALAIALELPRSPQLALLALPVAVLAAVVLHRYVERPVGVLRRAIRETPAEPSRSGATSARARLLQSAGFTNSAS